MLEGGKIKSIESIFFLFFSLLGGKKLDKICEGGRKKKKSNENIFSIFSHSLKEKLGWGDEIICSRGKIVQNIHPCHIIDPCSCDICGKSYQNKTTLADHKRRVHKVSSSIYREGTLHFECFPKLLLFLCLKALFTTSSFRRGDQRADK